MDFDDYCKEQGITESDLEEARRELEEEEAEYARTDNLGRIAHEIVNLHASDDERHLGPEDNNALRVSRLKDWERRLKPFAQAWAVETDHEGWGHECSVEFPDRCSTCGVDLPPDRDKSTEWPLIDFAALHKQIEDFKRDELPAALEKLDAKLAAELKTTESTTEEK